LDLVFALVIIYFIGGYIASWAWWGLKTAVCTLCCCGMCAKRASEPARQTLSKAQKKKLK